jgi:hypothetical protein
MAQPRGAPLLKAPKGKAWRKCSAPLLFFQWRAYGATAAQNCRVRVLAGNSKEPEMITITTGRHLNPEVLEQVVAQLLAKARNADKRGLKKPRSPGETQPSICACNSKAADNACRHYVPPAVVIDQIHHPNYVPVAKPIRRINDDGGCAHALPPQTAHALPPQTENTSRCSGARLRAARQRLGDLVARLLSASLRL